MDPFKGFLGTLGTRNPIISAPFFYSFRGLAARATIGSTAPLQHSGLGQGQAKLLRV